jgi:indolepyruvate ferredoxin oxidoreductase beta subunit
MTTKTAKRLKKDPTNLIIIGVAGQGNVLISQLVCNALAAEGYLVTLGQTYSSNQRGGSVNNYVRVSKEIQCSPLVPSGAADVIVGMEPLDTLRMLAQFGNPKVMTIVNPRPIDVAGRVSDYPDLNKLMETIKGLSGKTLVINATVEAEKLGDARMANMILTGALVATGVLPLDEKSMAPFIQERFPNDFDINMAAFSKGMELYEAAK